MPETQPLRVVLGAAPARVASAIAARASPLALPAELAHLLFYAEPDDAREERIVVIDESTHARSGLTPRVVWRDVGAGRRMRVTH